MWRAAWVTLAIAVLACATSACRVARPPERPSDSPSAPSSGAAGAASVSPITITVAADGTAQFRTVQEAVMSVPSGTASAPVIIRIRPGVYRELVYIQRERRFFRLVGEDAATTVVSFDLNATQIGLDGKPIGTFRTPTAVIDADDFEAERLTFENTAGPVGQALALRVDGDRAAFRDCRFLGWQDTILLNRGRQYFSRCLVTGHVDFIFGGATAYFDDCEIHVRRDGYITAASTPIDVPFGFVFRRARITGELGARTFLGRPWRDYAATAFLDTEMSDVVRPEGWHNWDRPERERTARYAEAGSTGAGAKPDARVAWARKLTPGEANRLTPQTVLAGDDGWNPAR